jgi:hypothetical protein
MCLKRKKQEILNDRKKMRKGKKERKDEASKEEKRKE